MWIDTVSTVLIGIGSFVALLVAMVGAVRWVVRRELGPLNDKIDTWISEHQRRHEDERAAIASAFEREGLHGPDGWTRSPRRRPEDHE